jgi:hypothetical protein
MKKVEYNLFLDDGWTTVLKENGKLYYKGYSTECSLEESLDKIIKENYTPAGKWCVIYDNQIFHPKMRGYPLYRLDNGFTNIPGLSDQVISSEANVTLNEPTISLDKASEIIGEILIDNTLKFLSYNKVTKLNVLFSMGLDSLTTWTIVDHLIKDYNLHISVPRPGKIMNFMGREREYTHKLIEHLDKYCWGYKMTSLYKDKNYYTTGFYSERIQLREVTNGHAIAKFYKTELHKMVNKNDYLYYFLQRPNTKVNTCDIEFQSEQDCKNYCFNSIFHDYQMWHIDQNFHFSPFYDIRIAETCYRLSLEDIVKNAANGIIQRKIIEKYNPQLLSLLSDYKNEGPIYKNFNKNWSKITLDKDVCINIK